MKKFAVQLVNTFTGKVIETEDERYDTLEEAEWEASESNNAFACGAEVLEDADESFIEPDSREYVVVEVDD